MRTKEPINEPPSQARTRPPDIQRRINAGWLRLWRAVYPDTPPPVEGRRQKGEGRRQRSEGRGRKTEGGRPAAVAYLARFLCAGFALALLVSGCAGPRPLKGGRAVTTRKPAGIVEQTLVQGENASQATKQDQETVKVRTYTLPAGSRIEEPQAPGAAAVQLSTINSQPINLHPSTRNPQLSTLNPQPLSPSAPQCP